MLTGLIIGGMALLGSLIATDNPVELASHSTPGVPAMIGHMAEISSERQNSDERRWSAFMVSAQAGDETDYRQLLTELAEVISRYLRSRFGNYDFIEDCVQEALIAIHQARHTYDPNRLFRPWLFAIVRRKAIDMLRMQRGRQRVLDQHRQETEIQLQADNPGAPEEDLGQGHLLDTLSAQHREALILTKIIGYTSAEAASQLGISQSALKVRVFRAIRKLRLAMEAEEQ